MIDWTKREYSHVHRGTLGQRSDGAWTCQEGVPAVRQDRAKKSPLLKDCTLAFLIGGAICVLGQVIMDQYMALGLSKTDASTATSVTLVFLSVLLTGLNLYNKLGRYGGAGTLVPITGFANAVASPAIDFKSEGADHRHGGEDVHRGRAGDRLRRGRQRGVWGVSDGQPVGVVVMVCGAFGPHPVLIALS